MTDSSRRWFLAGLFVTTLVTLCIEILFTRLLSVTLWYHLSFFAVSTAMFGMAAGALRVYLAGEGGDLSSMLARAHHLTLGFAWVVPLSLLVLLVITLPGYAGSVSTLALSVMTITTLAIAVPFFLSGMVVTIALTRVPGRIGVTYAVDLIGAALGTLLVVPLLNHTNIATAFFVCGALGAVGAMCFARARGLSFSWAAALSVVVLGAIAIFNVRTEDPMRPWHPKGRTAQFGRAAKEFWNVHSQVTLFGTLKNGPQYWGPGKGYKDFKTQIMDLVIDGEAATSLTKWDGSTEGLEWAKYDVTSMPYHVRPGGDAAVIGVGGGRDVLTALSFGCTSVTGVEINQVMIDVLEDKKRDVANLAGRPDVKLIHDEARSQLTRTEQRFDVLQMSLIDTWAATGAGAMTLSENGLYTLEAWDVFLRVLKPHGIFGVSRWYDSAKVSETSRLVALGVGALLRRGVAKPSEHMALLSVGDCATLLVSPDPLSAEDLARVQAAIDRFEFTWVLGPGHPPADEQLAAIYAADSPAALDSATQHPLFDFSPPTDERPFFFNLLKPRGALLSAEKLDSNGVMSGNLRATTALMVLFALSLVLVLAVIVLPLVSAGLPSMSRASFALSLWYFAVIGIGYMLVQIPSMQRFSVYLGHPVYALVVILFAMILATGFGSMASERVDLERRPSVLRTLPLSIAVVLLVATFALQPLIDATIGWSLIPRCAVVVAWIAPVALLLGFAFPIGMRLVRRVSTEAMPWMWGINGASSVFAAVLSIAVSMAWGIHANLFAAVLLYASLALVAPKLWKLGASA